MTAPSDDTLRYILGRYGLADQTATRFGTGLINDTYLVRVADDLAFVLQRLNRLFKPEVNRDIDVLTRHLALKGAVTQRLIPADNGDLWVLHDDYTWRMSTYVPGVCLNMLDTPVQAAAAGALLGSFHRDIRDLQLTLHTERLGVHDTQRHLNNLRTALEEHRTHRYFPAIAVLAREILAEAECLPALPSLPDRLVHGDPKISNLVFTPELDRGICMIDLDTLTYMPLPLELGDAFRSWCNPRGEDTQRSEFRLDLFSGAIEGYASVAGRFVLPLEWRNFVTAAQTIMVELAARFATDALREIYFGWNPDKFADRSTHNQIRAAGQLELYRSLRDCSADAEAIVAAAFDRST
jgi:Ser/Thr protein kinase RdoA (MazF antagonist)